ncbi:hypothetical protein GA0071314_1139 [Halomonas sp. HL-93]|nr:hypothetical protein GA0071314_1139 [Halomonas sp. HL-93]
MAILFIWERFFWKDRSMLAIFLHCYIHTGMFVCDWLF